MKKKKEALCLLFEISPAYQYHADQADDTDEAIEVPFVRYVSIQVVRAEVLYSENDYGYDNQYSPRPYWLFCCPNHVTPPGRIC
jgi:carotenoid cleavage dioxygenase-like enzyme